MDLSRPAETNSGRYWYNLHVVLVTAGRFRIGERNVFHKLRKGVLDVAHDQGYALSRCAFMPDHLHIGLRGNIEDSPLEIGLVFQNELAKAMGRFRVWEDEFYVGSFSEYGMDSVR